MSVSSLCGLAVHLASLLSKLAAEFSPSFATCRIRTRQGCTCCIVQISWSIPAGAWAKREEGRCGKVPWPPAGQSWCWREIQAFWLFDSIPACQAWSFLNVAAYCCLGSPLKSQTPPVHSWLQPSLGRKLLLFWDWIRCVLSVQWKNLETMKALCVVSSCC